MTEPEKTNPVDIRFAAMNYLAMREHTQKELLLKLKRRFPEYISLIQLQIQHLADENLQSDTRFAENYVQYRADRGYGLMRIRQELRERGLSDCQIAEAITGEDIDWFFLARKVFYKKFGELPAVEYREKVRRARFMQYRGFRSEEYNGLL